MKGFIIALSLISATVLHAQDRLEPYRELTKDDVLCMRFYKQELWRLLNPKNAEWGVFRDIELMTEASLTYDAASHSLVFTEIDGILWSDVCDATTKTIDKGNTRWYKHLKRVKRSYKSPGTKSTALVIPDSIAKKIKTLWITAVSTPAKNDLNLLGGVTWTFFADRQKAEGKGGEIRDWVRVPRLCALASNLIKAVQEQDRNMLMQLEPEIDELHRMFMNKE